MQRENQENLKPSYADSEIEHTFDECFSDFSCSIRLNISTNGLPTKMIYIKCQASFSEKNKERLF